MWHRGLLAKLSTIGVEGNLLNWFASYLSDRKQRVVIEGVHSDWRNRDLKIPVYRCTGTGSVPVHVKCSCAQLI